MKIACPSCHESYEVEAARLPSRRVRAACLACGEVLFLRLTDGAPASRAVRDMRDRAAPAVDEEVPLWGEPLPAGLEEALEAAALPEISPPAPEAAEARPAAEMEPPAPTVVEPAPLEVGERPAVEREGATPEPSPQEVAAPEIAEVTAPETETPPAQVMESTAPPSLVTPVVERVIEPAGVEVSPPEAAPPYRPEPVAQPARPPGGFIFSQVGDVSGRAQRLARALVSDILVYHPRKVDQGLREGNLRELMREEVEKSWDEFCERLGADQAHANRSHFVAALNEILARGSSVF